MKKESLSRAREIPCEKCMLISVCRYRNIQELTDNCSTIKKYLQNILWGQYTLLMSYREVSKFKDITIYDTPYANVYAVINTLINVLDSKVMKVKLGTWNLKEKQDEK